VHAHEVKHNHYSHRMRRRARGGPFPRQGALDIGLIDAVGVRLGLLFRKLTLANLAVMLAAVKEPDFCLMLFTEGFLKRYLIHPPLPPGALRALVLSPFSFFFFFTVVEYDCPGSRRLEGELLYTARCVCLRGLSRAGSFFLFL